MEKSRFSEHSPGRLVEVRLPRNDWSFVPDELPPNWEFPARLWPLLANAKEALGTLNGIGQTLPNPELLLRPLATREAIASSKIENTFVTPKELLLYELDPHESRTGNDKQADWMEVFNYGRAMRQGCTALSELPLCSRLIRDMHGTLMHGARGRDKSPGEFRSCAVQIGSSGRFIPPPAANVGRLMDNLEWYMNREDDLDRLVRCFVVHYQFEAIHPFADGNGRVGRALLALMIYHSHGHLMPWLFLSAYFERYQEEYVQKLFDVSTRGAWEEWIEYCLNGVIVQSRDSIVRCNLFHQLRGKYDARVDSHSPRTHQIIESLFASPVVTIPSVAKRFHVQYHTAQSDIERLMDAHILFEVGGTHPRSFFAPEIMRIAYDDDPGELSSAPSRPIAWEKTD